MKIRITDPEIIRSQEAGLFKAITENLDWEALSKVFRTRHRLAKITGIASGRGDFVALADQVAYRLDFDVRAVLGVVFDRSGNYLDVDAEVLEATPESASPSGTHPPGSEKADPLRERERPSPGEAQETVGLDQIVYGSPEAIHDRETAGRERPPRTSPPGEKMSEIATELADLISGINGKKKK